MTDGPRYYVEYFHSVSLTKSDIDQLGPQNLSFLSAILFAVNELFVFEKILSSTLQIPKQRYDEIQTLSFIQKSTIVRTISSKVLEFIKLYEDQNKIWIRRNFNDEICRMREHTENLKVIKESKFYDLSIEMRNKIINHYIVSEITKNLDHISEGADLSFQLHEEQGNSFFPVGEEIVFIGFINRYLGDNGDIEPKEDTVVFIQEWISWILSSIKWANKVVHDFSIFVLTNKLENKRLRRKMFCLDPNIVADIHQFSSPLILRDRRRKN